MTVKEFLERQKHLHPIASVAFLKDMLTLLHEFEGEKCSVLAGKIRAQLKEIKGGKS